MDSEMTEPTEVEAEFYPTPRWAIERMAEAVPLPRGRASFLDPCVGAGAIPAALDGRRWTTVDVRDTGHAEVVTNYLGWSPRRRFDCAVMNPPFSKALHFVDHAKKHCSLVIMLQRLNWLASEERATWLRANRPDAIYVLPNRIDFTGGGGGSDEHCWYVWGWGGGGIHVLNSTPLSIRSAQKPSAPPDRQQELSL